METEATRSPADRAKLLAGLAVFAAILALLGARVWDATAGQAAAARLARAASFAWSPADLPAPDFTLTAVDGSKVKLSDMRGQVVFLNFWATWCPPCRDEMPGMVELGKALSAKYPGKFRMVAVSVDEGTNPVHEFFAAPPYGGVAATGLTVLMDEDQAVSKAYYCKGRGECGELKFPETYIVDPTGKLVGYMVGPRDWTKPAARELLERLIGS